MIVLDQSIVNVALPSIQDDLGFSQTVLAWVVNAYLLTFGGFLLLSGRLGDLLGNRRVFLGGVVLFTIASVACGLAPSARAARRSARRPGARRRRRLRSRAVADHGAVHRARRPSQGDGRLRFRHVRWRRGRRTGRRSADRPALVALDLPGERARRHRRPRRRPRGAARRRRPARLRRSSTCPARCSSPRPDARGVRDRRRQRAPAGPRSGRWACWRSRRRPVRRVRRPRGQGGRAAGAAAAVQAAQRHGLPGRGRAVGRRDVRLVLPGRALPPAGARVRRPPGRPRVRPDQRS